MKKLILALAALITFSAVNAQVDSNTYTTFKSETINGSEGQPGCSHEWFPTVTNTDVKDTVDVNDSLKIIEVKTYTTSKQCTICGKQISVVNTWTTYLKVTPPDEDTTVGFNEGIQIMQGGDVEKYIKRMDSIQQTKNQYFLQPNSDLVYYPNKFADYGNGTTADLNYYNTEIKE